MQLHHPPQTDLSQVDCPHCPEQCGLELALRLEVDTEASVVLASCPSCQRIYQVQGSEHSEHSEHSEYAERTERTERGGVDEVLLIKVRCPHCAAVGHALRYAAPQGVESYTVMTCQGCQHTFRIETGAFS